MLQFYVEWATATSPTSEPCDSVTIRALTPGFDSGPCGEVRASFLPFLFVFLSFLWGLVFCGAVMTALLVCFVASHPKVLGLLTCAFLTTCSRSRLPWCVPTTARVPAATTGGVTSRRASASATMAGKVRSALALSRTACPPSWLPGQLGPLMVGPVRNGQGGGLCVCVLSLVSLLPPLFC